MKEGMTMAVTRMGTGARGKGKGPAGSENDKCGGETARTGTTTQAYAFNLPPME